MLRDAYLHCLSQDGGVDRSKEGSFSLERYPWRSHVDGYTMYIGYLAILKRGISLQSGGVR